MLPRCITHGGAFHADEVAAWGLIKIVADYHNIELPKLERLLEVFPVWENDETILLFDFGGWHNPDKMKFDHHHDGALPSANILILEAFAELMPHWIQESVYTEMQKISDIDTGKIPGGSMKYPDSLNYAVMCCNNLIFSRQKIMIPQDMKFRAAFECMKDMIESGVFNPFAYYVFSKSKDLTESLMKQAAAKLDKLELICNGKAVLNPSTDQIVGWAEVAESRGILVMISPNDNSNRSIIYRSKFLKIKAPKAGFFYSIQPTPPKHPNLRPCLSFCTFAKM